MDKFYVDTEVSDKSEEAVNAVRDIIEEIIEEVVSEDHEESVIMSASENIVNISSAIKLGKDRHPQQNESGYLSELEASVSVS